MTKHFAFSHMYFKTAAIIVLFSAFLTAGCQEKNSGELSTDLVTNANGKPKMTFREKEFHFGKIIDGEKVIHEFEFTNTGDGDLVISGADATCGCTVPEWPRQPIKPGGKGTIKVKFDSAGKEGEQEKVVTVTANTEPPSNTITIRGEVVKQASEQK